VLLTRTVLGAQQFPLGLPLRGKKFHLLRPGLGFFFPSKYDAFCDSTALFLFLVSNAFSPWVLGALRDRVIGISLSSVPY